MNTYKYEYRDIVNNQIVNGEITAKTINDARIKLIDWIKTDFDECIVENLAIIEV